MSNYSRKASVSARPETVKNLFSLHARIGALLFGLTLSSLALIASASAATITVGNAGDPTTGNAANCNVASTCTLRDAIAKAANVTGSAAGDTIVFSLPANSTIVLGGSELLVDRNLTIDGSANPDLAISGNHLSGVLSIDASGNGTSAIVILKGLLVRDGNYSGIYNSDSGTLALIDSAVSGNTADYRGGGIFNSGSLTLTDSTVSDNTIDSGAYGYVGGGGIFNSGTVRLVRSTVSGNTANGDGNGDGYTNGGGGGIFNTGTLMLTDSTISGNKAFYDGDPRGNAGGGIWNSGTLISTNGTVSGNTADYRGGGIYNTDGGAITLTDSSISDNTATNDDGGGIFSISSSFSESINTLTLIHSIVSSNTARNGGGICNAEGGAVKAMRSTISNNTATDGNGGGIVNQRGTQTLTDSAITGNKAPQGEGGGIYNERGLILANSSTISDNIATWGGGIGSYYTSTLMLSNSTVSGNTAVNGGGGIENLNALTLTNSTVSDNMANVVGAGIHNWGPLKMTHSTLARNTTTGTDDDIYNVNSPITSASVVNTIIQNCAADGSNTKPIVDNGGNVDGSSDCGLTDASSKSNATLDLGALADNGGPMPTMMPGANSDAIGFGLSDVCRNAPVNSRDQRGYVRPAIGCSSGAVDPSASANDSIFFDGFGFGG